MLAVSHACRVVSGDRVVSEAALQKAKNRHTSNRHWSVKSVAEDNTMQHIFFGLRLVSTPEDCALCIHLPNIFFCWFFCQFVHAMFGRIENFCFQTMSHDCKGCLLFIRHLSQTARWVACARTPQEVWQVHWAGGVLLNFYAYPVALRPRYPTQCTEPVFWFLKQAGGVAVGFFAVAGRPVMLPAIEYLLHTGCSGATLNTVVPT